VAASPEILVTASTREFERGRWKRDGYFPYWAVPSPGRVANYARSC